MKLSVAIEEAHLPYLEVSARLRKVSVTRLATMVMQQVLSDQMILNILDDDGQPVPKREGRGRQPEGPPADKLFDAVPKRKPDRMTSVFRSRTQSKTREELRRELAEAVQNTAGLPVE